MSSTATVLRHDSRLSHAFIVSESGKYRVDHVLGQDSQGSYELYMAGELALTIPTDGPNALDLLRAVTGAVEHLLIEGIEVGR